MGTAVINPVVAGLSAGSFAVGGPGGLPALPLRIAEVQARLPTNIVNNASHNAMVFRWPHVIPRDQTHIVLSFNAWYFNSSGLTESNIGNDYTLQSVSLTAPNGTVVPVTFSGGRTKVMANGDVNIQSDEIPISSFGYSSLPATGTWWSKGIATVASNGQFFPSCDSIYVGDVSNSQCATYSTAATTPSDTDVDGVYTATGTAFTNISHGLRPIILGRQVSRSLPTFFAIGDSNGEEIGDDGTNGIGGRGSVQRAMYNRGAYPFPCINLTRASNRFQAYTTGTKWREYIEYANVLVDQIGGNNVGDATALQQMKDWNAELWSDFRSADHVYIYKTFLLPRVDTTDSMATQANQTPRAGFGLGQDCDLLNDWYETKEADGTIDGIIGWQDIRASDPNKWKSTEVASVGGMADADGIHFSPTGHSVGGAWIRDMISPLCLPFSILNYNPLVWLDSRDESTILDANGVAANAGGFLGKVATFVDKSGNSRNTTQSTDANRPALRTFGGSVRALDFDGVNDRMAASAGSVQHSRLTYITVYLPDNTDQTLQVFANSGSGGSTNRCFTKNQACDFGGTALNRASPVSGVPILQFARRNNTGSSRQMLKINTDAELSGSVTAGGTEGNAQLGSYGNGSSGWIDAGVSLVIGIGDRLFAPEINRIAQNLVSEYAALGATLTWSDVAT